MSEDLHRIYGRARLDDRQINELIGLARGLIADDAINEKEVKYLQKWLVANLDVSNNPVTANLYRRIDAMLSDGVLDTEETQELLETLKRFSGGDFELGEVLKSTELPLDVPPPKIICPQCHFCFTGTFGYGTRKECEAAVERQGGECGSLTKKTDYLIIGVYSTGSWLHSNYGLKIQKAMKMKSEGHAIAIVGESHWRDFID